MTKKLDLHGVKHDEVDRLVENFVLMNRPPLTIVTGNSRQMAKLVKKVLDRHNLEAIKWGYATWKVLRYV